MQNLPNITNAGTMTSGIVPPPVRSQQPLHMQSTTPSVANGKDEMRGWLYKWTNVKKKYPNLFILINNFIFSI